MKGSYLYLVAICLLILARSGRTIFRQARILVGGVRKSKSVEEEDLSAVFDVILEAGRTLLHTWFDDEKGEPITGAYYVYVKRK